MKRSRTSSVYCAKARMDCASVELCHQRRIEIFGEKDEITFIARHGIDEELYLLKYIIESLVGTHLPLYQTYAHRGLTVDIRICRGLIIDIVPLEERGAMARFFIIGLGK